MATSPYDMGVGTGLNEEGDETGPRRLLSFVPAPSAPAVPAVPPLRLPTHRATPNSSTLQAEDPANALSISIINNDEEAFQATLTMWNQSGAVASRRVDAEGCTGLHWAALYGRLSMVEHLLRAGADPNAVALAAMHGKQTPLHWAVNQGRILVIEALLASGGDIDLRDDEGFDALLHGVVRGRALTVHFLVSHGANKYTVDPQGRSALHWTVIKQMTTTTQYLLNQGLSVNCVDSAGCSPLHYASAVASNNGLTRELIRWGADEQLRDEHGRTPVDVAAEAQSPSSVLYGSIATLGKHVLFPPKTLSQELRYFLFAMPSLTYAVGLWAFCSLVWWQCLLVLGCLWGGVSRFEYLWCPRFGSNPPTGAGYTFMNIAHIFVCFTFVLAPFYSPIFPATITVFYLITAVMVSCFYLATTADPGYFRLPSLTHHSIIEGLKQGAPLAEQFCATCVHYRPPRSKHCSTCDRCVARFDHHCGFISNCVGQNNHLAFVVWLITICLCNVIYLALCFRLILVDLTAGLELLQKLSVVFFEHPYLFAMTLFGVLHIAWLFLLAGTQLYLVFRNATTNEQINWGRYSYQRGKSLCSSDSSHGYELGTVHNVLQFAKCPGHTVDWTAHQPHQESAVALDV
ncbi:MAG: ankyrin repeat domain-containing protein [archaeon]|nr:ankyrin repeat domain-containing protein [archaeon]